MFPIADAGDNMRVAMITWEYPPRIVGGIARHCEGLAKALADQGDEVHIFTLDFPGASEYEETEGIRIYRTRSEVGHPNFLTWVLLFNHFIEKRIADVGRLVNFDVLHVHDWLTASAGIAFKHFGRRPLVFTAHSTEHGRSGLHIPDSFTIDGFEWWSTFEADKIIVTSGSMKGEVCGHFHLPDSKVEIVPNGIEPGKYAGSIDKGATRARYGIQPHEKMILCVGRLVPQKGIEYLLHAVPIAASLFLYRATYDPEYFRNACSLARDVLRLFASDFGPFYETGIDAEELIRRSIDGYDGVEPSGNSTMAHVLITLAAYGVETNQNNALAEGIFKYFSQELQNHGISYPCMLSAFQLYYHGISEVAVVGSKESAETMKILEYLNSRFVRFPVVAFSEKDTVNQLSDVIPLLKGRESKKEVTVYVCDNLSCKSPVNNLDELRGILD